MATKHILFVLLVATMLAGVGWAVLSGSDGPDPSVVSWSAGDEEELSEDEIPPDALGAELGLDAEDSGRTELETAALTGSGSDEERPEVRITGRVVDSYARPVVGARVVLEIRRGRGRFGGGNRINKPVETGADGRFSFQGPGSSNLSVSLQVAHGKHAPLIADRTFEEDRTDLDVGDLELLTGATLIGSITDPAGTGIPGATAKLVPQRGNRLSWTRNRDDLLAPAQTDQNGFFRLEHVMPGDYRVEASAPRRERETTDLVSLADGDEEYLDPIRLGPGFEILGTVYAPNGSPVVGADVSLRGRRGNRTKTDPEGKFAFDHLPGRKVGLRVSAKNYITHNKSDLDPETTGPLVIRLEAGLEVTGIARDAATGAALTRYAARIRRIGSLPDHALDAQAASVQATMQRLKAQLQALSADRGAGSAAAAEELRRRSSDLRALERNMIQAERDLESVRRQQSARGGDPRRSPGRGRYPSGNIGEVVERPDGKFVFSGLDEGLYQIDVDAPGYQRLRSESIEVRGGSPNPHVELQLQLGLLIEGVVLSANGGRPVSDARVQLVEIRETQGSEQAPRGRGFMGNMWAGTRPPGIPILTTKSDAQGRFSFEQAPPGRYLVAVRASGYAEKRTKQFDLQSRIGALTIELGGLARLSGIAQGIPRDREGDTRVVVFAGWGNMRNVEVRPDGSYEIGDLQPGSYMVRAFVGSMRSFINREMRTLMSGPGGTEPQYDVTIAEGEERSFNPAVIVEPIGELAGIVLHNGTPGKALRVRLQPLEESAGVPSFTQGSRRWSFAGRRTESRTNQKGEFLIKEVAEGRYALIIYSSRTRGRELLRQEVFVQRDSRNEQTYAVMTADIHGQVDAPDGADPSQLSGTVRLYAGVLARPADPRAFGRENTMHTLRVRGGVFEADEIGAGQYWMELSIRGRGNVERSLTVGSGDNTLRLTAGAANATPKSGGPAPR